MTEKQKTFANEYLIDLNGTRAYKAAYPNIKSDNVAAVRASKLLKTDEIKQYIDKCLLKMRDERIAKAEDVIIYLSDVLFGRTESSVLAMCGDGCQEVILKPPDERERLKAAELLGKRYGIFTERLDVKNENESKKLDAINALLEQMKPLKDDDV